VKYVAEKIAAIRDMNFEEIAQITLENGKRLFRI
jgi:TatD DNase family protein